MRSRFSASWPGRAALAAALAGLAALFVRLIHGDTLHYGFDYDDYYFLHPHQKEEVLASFHGPWDVTGVMVKFYRPLTVAFSALRFELFGLNAVAHHAASLALFFLTALMIAWLLFRFTRRPLAAALGTMLFVAHPAMPYSLVAWVTNQMHLIQMLCVLGALMWWDAIRRRGRLWWAPLLVFAVISFLIKEDGVLLLPAIIVLHTVRRHVAERDLPPIHWTFALSSVLLLGALILWRNYVLGELGGYARPTAETAWRYLSGTLSGVYRLVPADREWQPLASAFATWLPIVALAGWRWISSGARFCLIGGAGLAVAFALPFVFAAKPEQVYLVGTGFAITLTGASMALVELAARLRWAGVGRLLAAAILAAGIGSFVAVTRDITHDFEPFGPIVLSHDDIVQTWVFVPPELRDYLALKREPGAASRVSSNPVDELTVVTFGTHGRDVTPDGVPYMWMAGPRSEIYIAATARTVTVPLRHAIEALREPTRARIEADGRLADDLLLASSEWRFSTTALRPSTIPRLSGMHHLRIAIDHAWRPTDVIPGSTDGRWLGLQIGTPVVK